jgi:hypothetical protein
MKDNKHTIITSSTKTLVKSSFPNTLKYRSIHTIQMSMECFFLDTFYSNYQRQFTTLQYKWIF